LSAVPDSSPIGTTKNISNVELEPTNQHQEELKENSSTVGEGDTRTITIDVDYELKKHNPTPEDSQEKKDEGSYSIESNVSSYDFVDVASQDFSNPDNLM
jgi:hypothetical protein